MKKVSPLKKFWQFLKNSPWLPWTGQQADALPGDPVSPKVDLTLDADTLKRLARSLVATQEEEIGCDECFEQIDAFAELVLAGKPADEAMPLVAHHLEVCTDCRAEFEALLAAVRLVAE